MKELTLICQHKCKSLPGLLLKKIDFNQLDYSFTFYYILNCLLTEIIGDKKATIFRSSIIMIIMKQPSEYLRVYPIS